MPERKSHNLFKAIKMPNELNHYDFNKSSLNQGTVSKLRTVLMQKCATRKHNHCWAESGGHS